MQTDENYVKAMIKGSNSDGITMKTVAESIRRGENPNHSIPFMILNRANRRAVMNEAKRMAKKKNV